MSRNVELRKSKQTKYIVPENKKDKPSVLSYPTADIIGVMAPRNEYSHYYGYYNERYIDDWERYVGNARGDYNYKSKLW